MQRTVLIADDQEDMREALAAVVEADARLRLVAIASDAEESISLALEHRPDVALLDAKMPEGGGVRATRAIRAELPLTHVVILSAYGDRLNVFQLLEAGAIGYLVKGALASEICEALLRAADGQGVLSPIVTADVVHELADELGQRSEMDEARRRMRERISRALEPGSMSLVFQPIVEFAEPRAIGYEALARFELEPRRPPNEWFAEAALVGLGVELELAALHAALGHLRALPDGAFMAVNLSPSVLCSDELSALMADVPCERVVLELTEHAAVDDYEVVRAALAPLRRRGCRLAVDDAGAGFASLRHVLLLAPDLLKIDGSVTEQIASSRSARALIAALVASAKEMEQAVIAEAVETAQMVVELEALGVRYGQGYHFGRPAPLPARDAFRPAREADPT